jgi:hypothetical protein
VTPSAGGRGEPGAGSRGGLTLHDILDLRAYERVREDYRRRVMARKRLRRVSVGPIATLVFECVDTVRFQVQEMARVEKILTDEGIQGELDVYNRLLPSPGELSATLFIELTTEEELRHWLPRLVGIERSVAFELPSAAEPDAEAPGLVLSMPEAAHGEALTRDAVTPAVHYLRFPFTEAEVARFAAGPVALAVHHPEYQARTVLDEATRLELLADLEGRTEPLDLI